MAQEAVYIRIILEEMDHPQPATLLQTDNSMADGVVNGKIVPKRTKAIDSIGSATANARNNSVSIGDPANSTMPTIGQNTILANTTKARDANSSHHTLW